MRGQITRQRCAELNRYDPASHAANLLCCFRREFAGNRPNAVERPGVEIEGDCSAWRLRCGINTPSDRKVRTAKISDQKRIDCDPLGIKAQIDIGLLCLDTQDQRTPCLEREGAFARPSKGRGKGSVAEYGARDGGQAIDIDIGRRQRCIEAGQSILSAPPIGEAPRHAHAVELKIEVLDRDRLT